MTKDIREEVRKILDGEKCDCGEPIDSDSNICADCLTTKILSIPHIQRGLEAVQKAEELGGRES